MSTLDDIQRAASRLRALAEAATPGPWRTSDAGRAVAHQADYVAFPRVEQADSAYVATMDPRLGLALAGWLESQATDASEVMHYAYDIARLINGD